MRISPVYTPQNLVINPPHITNHPMLEVISTHMQEFEAKVKEICFTLSIFSYNNSLVFRKINKKLLVIAKI